MSGFFGTVLEAPVEATAPPGTSKDYQPRTFLVDEGVIRLNLWIQLHDILDELKVLLVKYLLYLVLCLGELYISNEAVLFQEDGSLHLGILVCSAVYLHLDLSLCGMLPGQFTHHQMIQNIHQ